MRADHLRHLGLGLALLAISGTILAIEAPWRDGSTVPDAPPDLPPDLARYPAAADFGGGTGWVNSEPLELTQLRGRVVLVDFWTYSCINCIHTFPYLRAWWDKYEDDGLVIVGVHTPEFRFERDIDNVRAATERYGLAYPVVLDNRYDIWDAYHNRYWPAEYLVDQYGRVRHTHFGEGGYDATEASIRELLAEAGRAPDDEAGGVAQEGTSVGRHSPELYAAAAQGEGRVSIGNDEGYHSGDTITYARPVSIEPDRIYLVGTWRNEEERVVAASDGASVLVDFQAGGANFVSDGPAGACVEVELDGAPLHPTDAARDVSFVTGTPCVVLDEPRSYDFYAGPLEWHTVELSVPRDFGLFTFAFAAEGRR
jgi:thiol-disulfide isomerase/thioredoxin